jgi:hypothetical protein
LRDTKASRHDLFQNNSTIQLIYTVINTRKENLRKLQEIDLTKNKYHFRAIQQHLAGRIA